MTQFFIASIASRAATFVLIAVTAGCYTTRVGSSAAAVGPTHSDRQWYTLGGLVGLSGPAGDECGEAGVATTQSGLSGIDILIEIGLGAAGGAAGLAICDSDAEAAEYASCVSSVASIVPILIGSRTVRYQCAGNQSARTLPIIPTAPSRDVTVSDAKPAAEDDAMPRD